MSKGGLSKRRRTTGPHRKDGPEISVRITGEGIWAEVGAVGFKGRWMSLTDTNL